jgi:2-oxoglutarate ferredoxin oxidoreductase subunit beta
MEIRDFNTNQENTWCPGCPNFSILQALKSSFTKLVNKKTIRQEDISIVGGIGCHGKMFDYINVNGFYGLHGRGLPVCLGMKIANPELTVLGFGGDGDTYAEGVSHFIHACRYNVDMTMVVHNNKVYALTTGQAAPTSEIGYIGGSTPRGVTEEPLNPIFLALSSGASFVARGYALDIDHLKSLFIEALNHKGFSLIDVLQPCITYHNVIPYLQKRVYKIEKGHNTSNLKAAINKALEWDYSLDEKAKIPIGIFYKKTRPTFLEQRPHVTKPWYKIKRKVDFSKTIQGFR